MQITQKLFEEEAKMAMAAKLVGIPGTLFLLNLYRFNVAMIDLYENELLADIENA